MEVCSIDLPSDFHPTMSVMSYGVVVVSDGVSTKVYKHYTEDINIIRQIEANLTVGHVTSIHCDPYSDVICFGKADGQVVLWSEERPDISSYRIEAETPVTAFEGMYVAHNRVVSKLHDVDGGYGNIRFDHRVTVPGNEPVTLIYEVRNTLLCFAGNHIYQYNLFDLHFYTNSRLSIPETDSVLCFAMFSKNWVVCPTGIYMLRRYNGEKFNDLREVELFNNENDGYDVVKAVSACVFGHYVAILFDNRQLSISTEINNRMRHVAEIEVEALGQLCGPSRGHAFTLVTRDKIIRYGLSGQEVSATEDSDSSSEDEGPAPVEEEPSSAAGGRGTKRPASDPHKVKGEVLRLMQHLSKEERIALIKELNSEKCPVCLDEYNNPEDAEKDPVLGECGHTVCKVCEPHLKSPKQCPSCRQKWKPAEFALLLV